MGNVWGESMGGKGAGDLPGDPYHPLHSNLKGHSEREGL